MAFPKEIILKPNKKGYSLLPGKHETLLIQSKYGITEEQPLEIQLTLFDSGKQSSILIKSLQQECLAIHLKDTHINFADTYMGHKSMRTTQIVNNTDSKMMFQFYISESEVEEPFETDDKSCNCDMKLLNCSEIGSKMIPFQSKYFEIVPSTGEISPKSLTTINIMFQPPSIVTALKTTGSSTFIDQISNLSFTSCSSNETIQAELHMTGVMLGPKIHFDSYEVQIKSVHCGETVEFDLVCFNSGLIDGEINFKVITCTSTNVQDNLQKLFPYKGD